MNESKSPSVLNKVFNVKFYRRLTLIIAGAVVTAILTYYFSSSRENPYVSPETTKNDTSSVKVQPKSEPEKKPNSQSDAETSKPSGTTANGPNQENSNNNNLTIQGSTVTGTTINQGNIITNESDTVRR